MSWNLEWKNENALSDECEEWCEMEKCQNEDGKLFKKIRNAIPRAL